MFRILVVLFILVPMIELALLIEVGRALGVGMTLLLIFGTGVLGAYLAKTQGVLILQRIQSELNVGKMPSEAMFDGVLILIGGIVLLTPGLVTDAMGFFLLIPACRSLIKLWLRKRIQSELDRGNTINITQFKIR